MVDTLDSKSSISNDVRVRASSSAHTENPFLIEGVLFPILIPMNHQISHDSPISGYIFRDTVVLMVAGAGEITP